MVPQKTCAPRTRRQCRRVPRQRCRRQSRQSCQTLPKQECAVAPRQECREVCEDTVWCRVCDEGYGARSSRLRQLPKARSRPKRQAAAGGAGAILGKDAFEKLLEK